MRVRKVVTRRGRNIRGYFPSVKLGRMVAWESLLERDAILLAELSPGVIHYQEQPEVISYWDGHRQRDYVPDLAITLSDEKVIHIEVKPSSELAKPSLRSKYGAIAAHYQRTGTRFRILTELEIRREPRFGNLQMLAVYARHGLWQCPDHSELVRLLNDRASLVLAEWDDLLGRSTTFRLIAAGLLTCNLEQPFSPESVVALAQGGCHATVLL
ncbi:TnsA endonuclease N-terminal domain-containing protein [Jeongeupia sp. USM3]|uniref:TnsA endonuclease N-terminal domain-containing protein n=1 Tax=Jeongeupia sp. USM3 TaxID=1906741 RepID=UPI00089DE272|nr:TnsA endonuclease N-terminal domain-containing protein [Jeongeupia sp. USM3]AOY00917.1 hypothetical protein BJP62_10980 [Jeongeupia sp. USM3]